MSPRVRRFARVGHCLSGLVVAVLVAAGCDAIVVDEECPDLTAVCPDVACEGPRVTQDGCETCACESSPAATVCWDDNGCAADQRCDLTQGCEPAPSCAAGGPCPDVCYGLCVDAALPCDADGDCAADEVCAPFSNARGADGAGLCLGVDCDATDVALPECPPGSEVVFDAAVDACAAVCVAIDRCRELLPAECASTAGCHVVEDDVDRCAAVDDCAALPVDQCESLANCVLKAVGAADEPDDAPPTFPTAPCEEGDPSCPPPAPAAPQAPDEPALVCVPRGSDGVCLDDADCFAGDSCELATVCGAGCVVDDDGEEHCFEQCWTEAGQCVADDYSCFELDAETCTFVGACELVDGVCAPRSAACAADDDCAAGQHCALVETCPACDPSSADFDCIAPCFVEGSCVNGQPPPVPCAVDADCGSAGVCVVATVCETCTGESLEGEADGGFPVAPPSCQLDCRDEGFCVPLTAGGALPLCQDNGDCGAAQRCAVELDACLDNPDAPNSGCWTYCVSAGSRGDGDQFCFDDDECGPDETCHFDANVCLDDPSQAAAACSGWCDGGCAEVETLAHDPASGQCVLFPDSCIPPDWVPGC